MIAIVDVIENIVKEVQTRYDLESGEKPYFLHGHPQEIVNILSKKSAHDEFKYKKYPFIIY